MGCRLSENIDMVMRLGMFVLARPYYYYCVQIPRQPSLLSLNIISRLPTFPGIRKHTENDADMEVSLRMENARWRTDARINFPFSLLLDWMLVVLVVVLLLLIVVVQKMQ